MAKVDMAGATVTEAAAGELDLTMKEIGEVDLARDPTAMAGETMESPQEASSLEDLRQATETPRAVAKAGEMTKVPRARAPANPGPVVATALNRAAALEKVALTTLAPLETAGVLEKTATREALAAQATTGVAEATAQQVAGGMTTRVREMAREVLTVAAMEALDRAPLAAAGEQALTRAATTRDLTTTRDPPAVVGEPDRAPLVVRRDLAAAGEVTTMALIARAVTTRAVDGNLVLENLWPWLATP